MRCPGQEGALAGRLPIDLDGADVQAFEGRRLQLEVILRVQAVHQRDGQDVLFVAQRVNQGGRFGVVGYPEPEPVRQFDGVLIAADGRAVENANLIGACLRRVDCADAGPVGRQRCVVGDIVMLNIVDIIGDDVLRIARAQPAQFRHAGAAASWQRQAARPAGRRWRSPPPPAAAANCKAHNAASA